MNEIAIPTILVVSPDGEFCRAMQRILGAQGGYRVLEAESRWDAEAVVRDRSLAVRYVVFDEEWIELGEPVAGVPKHGVSSTRKASLAIPGYPERLLNQIAFQTATGPLDFTPEQYDVVRDFLRRIKAAVCAMADVLSNARGPAKADLRDDWIRGGEKLAEHTLALVDQMQGLLAPRIPTPTHPLRFQDTMCNLMDIVGCYLVGFCGNADIWTAYAVTLEQRETGMRLHSYRRWILDLVEQFSVDVRRVESEGSPRASP